MRRTGRRTLTAADAAWLAAIPCALLTLAAVVVLGPPLGQRLLAPRGGVLLPEVTQRPEPGEHGRYLVALLGPLALAAAVAWLSGRRAPLPDGIVRLTRRIGEWTLLAFLVACLLAQQGIVPGAVRLPWSPLNHYFHLQTIAAAAAFSLLLSLVLSSRRAMACMRGWTAETRRRRVLCAVAAITFSAAWLLRAVDVDRSFGNEPIHNLIPWQMDEAFAVLDGGTPLVDVHLMYSQLLSVIVAGVMVPFGASAGTWTVAMATLSGFGLLAVYALLRRMTRGSLPALALFLPFAAISLWIVGPPRSGISLGSIFSIWPMRYGGPYVLAWLTARHLDGVAPRHSAVVFLLGGLVAINNLEFGLGALVATFSALALATPHRSGAAWTRLAVEAAAGLTASVGLVSAFALVRTGRLPQPGVLLEFPSLFGVEGWVAEPMPTFGLHLTIFATLAAAIIVAAVHALQQPEERLLACMLVWAGTFGLGAGSYYVGRSNPGNLIPLFSAWSLALSLLLIVVVRALAARPRRPTPAEAAVMLAFGLALACVPNAPSPLAQVARLERSTQPIFRQVEAARFIRARTERGERVEILAPLGHRIAYDLGLRDVSPYTSIEAMPAIAQVQRAMMVARRLGVRRVFVRAPGGVGEEANNAASVIVAFQSAGYAVASQGSGLVSLVADARPR